MKKESTSSQNHANPAEHKPSHAQSRFEALLEQVEEMCFVLNHNFQIIYTNRWAQSTFDFKAEDMLGHSFIELLPYGKAMPELAATQQALANGEVFRANVQSPLSGRWFRMIAAPFQDEYLFCLKEITVRKRYQQLLIEKDAQFRAISEAMTDFILIINTRGRIVYASPASGSVIGYPADELENQTFSSLIEPESERHIQQQLQTISAEPESRSSFELVIRHQDGSKIELNAQAQNLTQRSGVEGILLNLRPIA